MDSGDNIHNMIILFYKMFKENDSILDYSHSPLILECKIDI